MVFLYLFFWSAYVRIGISVITEESANFGVYASAWANALLTVCTTRNPHREVYGYCGGEYDAVCRRASDAYCLCHPH